jgi:hypothetical protein
VRGLGVITSAAVSGRGVSSGIVVVSERPCVELYEL